MDFKLQKHQLLLGLLLVIGVGWSVRDYKLWRNAELDKYGHGYGEEIPPLILGNLYENQFWGVRIRYPGGWIVDEADEFVDLPPKKRQADLLAIGQRKPVVWLGKNVKLSVERVKISLVDLANREEGVIKNKQPEMVKEREYINTEEVNVIYFTWKEGGIMHQRAMTSEGDKMIVVDSDTIESEWKSLEPTFREMYKSLVMF